MNQCLAGQGAWYIGADLARRLGPEVPRDLPVQMSQVPPRSEGELQGLGLWPARDELGLGEQGLEVPMKLKEKVLLVLQEENEPQELARVGWRAPGRVHRRASLEETWSPPARSSQLPCSIVGGLYGGEGAPKLQSALCFRPFHLCT